VQIAFGIEEPFPSTCTAGKIPRKRRCFRG